MEVEKVIFLLVTLFLLVAIFLIFRFFSEIVRWVKANEKLFAFLLFMLFMVGASAFNFDVLSWLGRVFA